MTCDPESSKGMSSAQIIATLLVDEMHERNRDALQKNVRCASCFDSGVVGGVFCVCNQGAKLAIQASGIGARDE